MGEADAHRQRCRFSIPTNFHLYTLDKLLFESGAERCQCVWQQPSKSETNLSSFYNFVVVSGGERWWYLEYVSSASASNSSSQIIIVNRLVCMALFFSPCTNVISDGNIPHDTPNALSRPNPTCHEFAVPCYVPNTGCTDTLPYAVGSHRSNENWAKLNGIWKENTILHLAVMVLIMLCGGGDCIFILGTTVKGKSLLLISFNVFMLRKRKGKSSDDVSLLSSAHQRTQTHTRVRVTWPCNVKSTWNFL